MAGWLRISLVALGAWLALGSAGGAAPPAQQPVLAARAWAIRVLVPGLDGATTGVVSAPPAARAFLDGWQYPADGTVVRSGAVTVTVSTGAGAKAPARAESDVTSLSLFGGEITADGVSGRAQAAAVGKTASGDVAGSTVANLVALGQPVTPSPGLGVPLADWGSLVVLAQRTSSWGGGGRGRRASVAVLEVRLSAEHAGLAAGSVIQVGHAEASAYPARPVATEPAEEVAPPRKDEHTTARETPAPDLKILARQGPLGLLPELGGGPYAFPVYGTVAYGDLFGVGRSDVPGGWHHGDDIFGQVGQPVLAVADGTLFQVGWIPIGGYRLWLRDRKGNQFYYAHLSAFAAATRNGVHVRAGAVIGFMGTTGDAVGSLPHLHFEIHPVSLLFLDYDGAVNPTPYLGDWLRVVDLTFANVAGWAPPIRGGVPAPEPGAILLGVRDISTADGLDPASLRRVLGGSP